MAPAAHVPGRVEGGNPVRPRKVVVETKQHPCTPSCPTSRLLRPRNRLLRGVPPPLYKPPCAIEALRSSSPPEHRRASFIQLPSCPTRLLAGVCGLREIISTPPHCRQHNLNLAERDWCEKLLSTRAHPGSIASPLCTRLVPSRSLLCSRDPIPSASTPGGSPWGRRRPAMTGTPSAR